MKHLSSYIQYLIRRFDKVIIPGVGALVAVELPPFFSDSGQLILAPKRTVYFDDEITEDDTNLLLQTVLKGENCSENHSIIMLNRKIAEIKNAIFDHGMFILGRLGQFYRKSAGIYFIPGTDVSSFDSFSIFADADCETSADNVLSRKVV